MKNLFSKLSEKKGSNSERFKTIILSVVCSIIIWLMIVYINDPSITITLNDVDVRFSGEVALKDQGFVLTGKNELPSMSVSVSGKRSDLMDYMDNVYINVNIEEVTAPGEHAFSTDVELPTSKLTLEKGGPAEVTLNVEPLVKKSIQILTKQTGSNKNYLVKSEISDDYVEISGAKSEVADVAYGIAIVDISSVEAPSEGEYAYAMYNKENIAIEKNETLEAQKAAVHVKNTPYMKISLPVIPELSADLAKEYVIDTSKTICTPSIVEVGINSEFNGSGVGAVIDKLTDTETEFYLNSVAGLYIPYERTAVKIKPVLLKKQTKTLHVKIHAVNVPSGMTADFVQELDVTLDCAENVTAENVTAEIDLTDLDKGTHHVPVQITGDRVASFVPISIDVTIK